jgi:lipid-A-disaccharide synthase
MKYYIIAGEASGDLHGSNLIREIRRKDHGAEIFCWGGDMMQAAGGVVRKHYRDLAFMGFWEVFKNLPSILKNLSFCKQDILHQKPDAVIFIDYPGFNLRMAKWAKLNGFTTIYYISPQVWAWKENRVKGIKKYIDKMLVILPFEKSFYKKWNYPVQYVGHPLIQVVDDFRKSFESMNTPDKDRTIALLPGSRRQEILKKLPEMLKATTHFPDYHFKVAAAPGIENEFYEVMMQAYPGVELIAGDTYGLLCSARAALVTSGTATLETALFRVPQVICYKGNPLSYLIARQLVKIKFIGLVNLIMDKEVVKELIQDELNEKNLVRELRAILEEGIRRQEVLRDYENLYQTLSKGGQASEQAAAIICGMLPSLEQ